MIEQTNEIVRKFNNIYKTNILKEAKPILSNTQRLVGIDGNAKASKSLNNCIFLSDCAQTLKAKVMSMYTDPNHIRITDPGQVEGNVVFEYLTAFSKNQAEVEELKKSYQKGGLGDIAIKQKLIAILEDLLEPIRSRRNELNKNELEDRLYQGCFNVNQIAQKVLQQIKEAMKINFDIKF
jgi:tryptophanyl-tRNA synthetase